jgi:uncharacterized membrane protein
MKNPNIYNPVGISAETIKPRRIESIDLLRGIIIIIMALDHVRDYFHAFSYIYDPTDLQHTTAPIFLTRWITHYCAPVFTLLAGIAACLYGLKNGRKALSYFLFTRGIWLLFLELFFISLMWTFNPFYAAFILQVIWVFGISMITLALLIRLPRAALLTIGLVLVFGNNALDGIQVTGNGIDAIIWSLLHQPNFSGFRSGPFNFIVGYSALPYIGIISLGYCLGSLFTQETTPEVRQKWLRNLGIGIIVLFIILRWTNIYGDSSPWSQQKNFLFTFFSFINVSKYPPSLLYILMTTGPALLFLAYAERPLNWLTSKLIVFGRVPMFFYLIHLPVIHGLAVLASAISGQSASNMINLTTWVTANPQLKGYGFSLPVVYFVWIAVILILYPICGWFSKYKQQNQRDKKWLSYF